MPIVLEAVGWAAKRIESQEG